MEDIKMEKSDKTTETQQNGPAQIVAVPTETEVKRAEETMGRVDAALKSGVLRPKAKALLLLTLCQVYSVVMPEKAKTYYQQLAQVQANVPDDFHAIFADLRQTFEQPAAPRTGFAGERIAEINAVLAKPGLGESETRTRLKAVEEVVRRRFWPFGKEPVWEALVNAWIDIDRAYALQLSAKIHVAARKTFVRRANQQRPLTPDEWYVLSKATSPSESADLVLQILEDPQPRLDIPGGMVPSVVTAIRARLSWSADTDNRLKGVLDTTEKLVGLVGTGERLPHVFESLKATAREVAMTGALSQQWPERFSGVARLISIGVSSGAITDANVEDFAGCMPSHMTDFARAHCAALLAREVVVRENLARLLQVAHQKAEAEAWFLVMLVHRGMGELAYVLAKESARSSAVLPRVRRAWLCNYTHPASATISPSEVEGDPAAQILLHAPGAERVSYLRELTDAGKKPLPGAVWASEKPPEQKKGFWASLTESGKSVDQVADEYLNEYLKRNPLYSSYTINTPDAQQFAEYLRFGGYGEYGHELIDQMLLNAFVLWADDRPEEVKALLHLMWKGIRPEEDILQLDFLRNAIFTRCVTVFASSPDVLVGDFLSWLKRTLIDKALGWQVGKTEFWLHLPESVLSDMCIRSALAVHEISSACRDRLVEIALTRYPAEPGIAELGAQLYNTGKETLDLTLPWKTRGDVEKAWQVGIVKNTILPIIQAVVLEGLKRET
jgi:hypothetical protein